MPFTNIRSSFGTWRRTLEFGVRRGGSWTSSNTPGVAAWVMRGGVWRPVWGDLTVPGTPENLDLQLFFSGGNEFGTASLLVDNVGYWCETRVQLRRTDNGLPNDPDSPYLTSAWTANGAPGTQLTVSFASVQRWLGTTRFRASVQHRNANSLVTGSAVFSETETTVR